MKKIDILVRGLIIHNGKILVCKKKNKRYYFLPGGHVEFGESAIKALKRELKEELDLLFKKYYFVGGSEHRFIEEKKVFQEINLVFRVFPKKLKTKSKENHLQFFLLDKKQFSKEKILPKILKRGILNWLKNKKIFWATEIK